MKFPNPNTFWTDDRTIVCPLCGAEVDEPCRGMSKAETFARTVCFARRVARLRRELGPGGEDGSYNPHGIRSPPTRPIPGLTSDPPEKAKPN